MKWVKYTKFSTSIMAGGQVQLAVSSLVKYQRLIYFVNHSWPSDMTDLHFNTPHQSSLWTWDFLHRPLCIVEKTLAVLINFYNPTWKSNIIKAVPLEVSVSNGEMWTA